MTLVPQISNPINLTTETLQIPSKSYKLLHFNNALTKSKVLNANGMFLDLVIDTTISDEPIETKKLTESDRIIGFVDGLEAVKQSVYHILTTERYSYDIYDNNYGVELMQYIGKDYEFLETTIENTLREALTYDLRITDVNLSNIKQTGLGIVHIEFTVISIYGNLQVEVNLKNV